MFNDHELELLISGLPEIDIGDLRANTEYAGYSAASRVVQWFWEVVGDLDKEDLALLVQFVTGTSKVPLDGFKALQVRRRGALAVCISSQGTIWVAAVPAEAQPHVMHMHWASLDNPLHW